MNKKRPSIKLVPVGDAAAFEKHLYDGDESKTLRQLLQAAPALALEPILEAWMDRKVSEFSVSLHDRAFHVPPGLIFNGAVMPAAPAAPTAVPDTHSQPAPPSAPKEPLQSVTEFPSDITERDAVLLPYHREIDNVAGFLRAGLSALVVCDKLVVDHLWREIASRAHLEPVRLEVPEEGDDGGFMQRGLRQRQLARLKKLIAGLKEGHVLVVPHLDLLAGGTDANPPTETRELIELVYEQSDRLMLAFADPSMAVPEVLASRFAVRILISGVPRTVSVGKASAVPIGKVLVTRSEADSFQGYDPEGLYKNIAGMNPVRIRHAIKYSVKEFAGPEKVPVAKLYQAIRAFKAQTSSSFEVPDVRWEDIGGYEEVKSELERAIQLMVGSFRLEDEKLQRELIPRGFLFHGPPGTGKTLFAKAVANRLNATVLVVSGPEVTDMYVGESERKVRELFAEARRNAPAVLVFDEFDSIATKRSGRDDGGSRAGNALVAQILTEMDGFRPDVPMLVVGTTNRLDIIDEALLRPSRFRAIAIGLPNRTARRAIAEVHAGRFKIQVQSGLLDIIADATEGFNGDDVRSLFRDACVGLLCQEPRVPADAYRFGVLVGSLRRAAEERRASKASHRESVLTDTRAGQRPRPTGPMMPLRSGPPTPVQPTEAPGPSATSKPAPPPGAPGQRQSEIRTPEISDEPATETTPDRQLPV